MGKARKKFVIFEELDSDGYKSSGNWRWHLRSGNSRIIANGGEPFVNVNSALRAVKQINELFVTPLPVEVEQ